MYLAKLFNFRICLAVLLLLTSAVAQQIRFEDFSNIQDLDLNGRAHQATWNEQYVLRLTDGLRTGTRTYSSSVWFDIQQPLTVGFTTYFAFQIHNPAGCCSPGDGLAFVIQNASATDYCGSGSGKTALGVPSGGVGYTGIENSIAVELDTTQDPWDPNANHVAMQSCGTQANTAAHAPGSYPICGGAYQIGSCLYDPNGISSNIPHLGVTCGQSSCQDGSVHQVVIEYTGASGENQGNIKIYVDPLFIQGTHTPAQNAVPQVNLPFTIENVISIPSKVGYVGFTASQASASQTTDLLIWEFTPHEPVQIQQKIKGQGMENEFDFGNHVYGVTYPKDFNNDQGILMTVDAMPIDKQTFYLQRLVGTNFSNEQCITYLSTGGNCVVYEVTCQNSMQQNIPCPNPNNNELIDTRTSYSTTDNVNADNADYIKAQIGTNNWCSIFTGFSQNDSDPRTSGSGDNFSDFVATFKPHGGQDPHCPGAGAIRGLKKPQTNSVRPTSNSLQESGLAGSNK